MTGATALEQEAEAEAEVPPDIDRAGDPRVSGGWTEMTEMRDQTGRQGSLSPDTGDTHLHLSPLRSQYLHILPSSLVKKEREGVRGVILT